MSNKQEINILWDNLQNKIVCVDLDTNDLKKDDICIDFNTGFEFKVIDHPVKRDQVWFYKLMPYTQLLKLIKK